MDMGVSLLPILSLQGCRRDRDALAADVVEHIHFVGKRPAGEHFEYVQGLFQSGPRRAAP